MDSVERPKEWQKEMTTYQNKTGLVVIGVSAKSGLNLTVE